MSTYITTGAIVGTEETGTEGTTTPSTSVQVQRLKQSTKTTSAQRQRTRERWVPERTTQGSGGGSEPPFDSTRAILNDLARGQQEMRNAITQMALNSQIIQNNLSMIGASIAGAQLVIQDTREVEQVAPVGM
jgi:hypothetical protein